MALERVEEEAKKWEQAHLGRNIYWGEMHLAFLVLRSDPTKRVYTSLLSGLQNDSFFTAIPLIDHTPQDRLAEEAYLRSTFMGEVDPEKYRAFATGEFNSDKLLAFLNRENAGVSPDDITKWFYKTFGLGHQKQYGPVSIGSQGGMYPDGLHYNVTIEGRRKMVATAAGFAQVVEKSLPQISLSPLPVETYMQDLQSALKFLPRDWGVSQSVPTLA